MVSIAVNQQRLRDTTTEEPEDTPMEEPEDTATEAPERDKLRHSAVWYPDVPPAAVSLNEDCFIPFEPYTKGFRPLFWTHFGGPGGRYLRNLTMVTVHFFLGIRRIDFSFNTEEVPTECRSFGRYKDSSELTPIRFPIDGPGGEVITRVRICQSFPAADDYSMDSSVEWHLTEGELKYIEVC
jgi:hypothetical protein